MEYKDYYHTLGIEKTANADEIKKQYRRLARKYHPDVSKEKNAEAKFKEVKEAYEVLKDPEKRKAYDQMGSNPHQGQGFEPPPGWDYQGDNQNTFGEHDFSDFFSQFFGKGARHQRHAYSSEPERGHDQHAKINISLYDAFHGATREIQLNDGEKTKNLKVKIPAGVQESQQIRLAGQGGMGGTPGDLYLEIHIETEKNYHLQGKDIYFTLPVAPWEAALGETITISTVSGTISIKIPESSENGKKLRVKGKGLPGNPPGDLYLILEIAIPAAKTEADKKLYRQMAEQMHFNPRDISSRQT